MTDEQKIERLIQSFVETRRSMGKGLVWKLDLTKAQCDVLWEIHNGARRNEDLARSLQMTPSAVTQLVSPLVEGGYVSRVASETDRREARLRLTPAGRKVLRQLHKLMRTRAEYIASVLTDEELEQFINISKKIACRLREKGND